MKKTALTSTEIIPIDSDSDKSAELDVPLDVASQNVCTTLQQPPESKREMFP